MNAIENMQDTSAYLDCVTTVISFFNTAAGNIIGRERRSLVFLNIP